MKYDVTSSKFCDVCEVCRKIIDSTFDQICKIKILTETRVINNHIIYVFIYFFNFFLKILYKNII